MRLTTMATLRKLSAKLGISVALPLYIAIPSSVPDESHEEFMSFLKTKATRDIVKEFPDFSKYYITMSFLSLLEAKGYARVDLFDALELLELDALYKKLSDTLSPYIFPMRNWKKTHTFDLGFSEHRQLCAVKYPTVSGLIAYSAQQEDIEAYLRKFVAKNKLLLPLLFEIKARKSENWVHVFEDRDIRVHISRDATAIVLRYSIVMRNMLFYGKLNAKAIERRMLPMLKKSAKL